jgi:uncharacterized protein RhaS with RHS repeats
MTAFKMKGHTLPGIKQRKVDRMEDGRPGSSTFQYKESPAKQKGDNLKRIMSEKKAVAKKTGTWYKPGAEPKVKVPNIKGFNVTGSDWPEKTPGYSSTKIGKATAQDKAVEKLMTDKNIGRKAFDTKLSKITKGVKKAGKFLGGKTLGTLGMMMGTTSKADQPKVKKSEREQMKDLLTKHKLKGGRK